MTDPNSLAIFAKVVEASSISGPGLGLSLRAPRVSSKNSKANRIETGESSGGIGEICSVEVDEKIAKKIADHSTKLIDAVKRRRRAIDQKAMLSTLR